MFHKNLNESNTITKANTTAAGETAKRIRTHLGARGTVTGHMRWDPLAYPCKDGSVNFLFQVDAVPGSRGPDGRPAQEPLRMRCHIPADLVQFTPFVWLRQGHMVTVRYVVRTDYYRDAAGQPASSTYLDVEEIVRQEEDERDAARPNKRESYGPAASRGGDRRRENRPSGGRPGQQAFARDSTGYRMSEASRGAGSPGGHPRDGRRSFSSPAGRPAWNGQSGPGTHPEKSGVGIE